METKYGFDIPQGVIHSETLRLTNQLWKLIPMREKEEDWSKQLDSVILDIVGKSEIFISNSLFLQLLSKLEGLKVQEVNFMFYRKTIFECINLLQEIDKDNER